MNDLDFSKDNNLTKWIKKTDEYKEVTGRILALQIYGKNEFVIDRGLYKVAVILHAIDTVKDGVYFDFDYELIFDIRIFDTERIICVPSLIKTIYIKGKSSDYIFKNKRIGGFKALSNNLSDVYIQKGAFSNLSIRCVAPSLTYYDESNTKLSVADIYFNCTLEKLRDLWYTTRLDDYKRFIDNHNKVEVVNCYHISMQMGDVLEDKTELVMLLNELSGIAVKARISIMGSRSIYAGIHPYVEDVKDLTDSILNLAKQVNIDLHVIYVTPIISKAESDKEYELRSLDEYLREKTEELQNCNFMLYA